jgi:hypothetical protein
LSHTENIGEDFFDNLTTKFKESENVYHDENVHETLIEPGFIILEELKKMKFYHDSKFVEKELNKIEFIGSGNGYYVESLRQKE